MFAFNGFAFGAFTLVGHQEEHLNRFSAEIMNYKYTTKTFF